jgi:hypothetical protein
LIGSCTAEVLDRRSHPFKVKQRRHEIQVLAGETGLEIGKFRKIVQMVQKGEREARQEANLRLVSILGENASPVRRLGLARHEWRKALRLLRLRRERPGGPSASWR